MTLVPDQLLFGFSLRGEMKPAERFINKFRAERCNDKIFSDSRVKT